MVDAAKLTIFISYSHKDQPDQPKRGEVQWLTFVKTYLAPIAALGSLAIWDDQQLRGGDQLDPSIKARLAECRILVLLVSPHSLASSYVLHTEVKALRQRQGSGEAVQIFPIVLTPTPRNALAQLTDLVLKPRDGKPLSLMSVRGREVAMAAIADEIFDVAKRLTDGLVDGRTDSAARVQSPTTVPMPSTGVVLLSTEEYDRISKAIMLLRDEERRAAERVSEAAAALASVPPNEVSRPRIDAALAELKAGRTKEAERIFREVQDEREREGQGALNEASEAARHRAALVYTNNKAAALDALRESVRLDPTNRSAWLDLGEVAVAAGSLDSGAQAFSQYRKLAEERQDQREMMIADNRIGDIARAQGKLDEALQRYCDGLSLAQRLAASEPSKTDLQNYVSQGFNNVGDVLLAQGKLDEALWRYRDGLATMERLAAGDPTNTEWQRDLSGSFNRVGDVLRAQGKLDEALQRHRDALAIAERLTISNPTNTDWQTDLSRTMVRVGDVLLAQGKLGEALKRYRDGLAIVERLTTGDPTNTDWQRDLSLSFSRVGDALQAQGKPDEALRHYRDGLAIVERLATGDPTNTDWQNDISGSFNRVGDALQAQGKLDEALERYRDGLAIVERLATGDPTNTNWQHGISLIYNKIGDVLLAQGKLDEALERYRDDLAVAERLAAGDPSNTDWQRDLSVSHNKIGDVLLAQGKVAEALKSYRLDLSIAERLAAADSTNATWQVDLAIALDRVAELDSRKSNKLRTRALSILETLRLKGPLAPEHESFFRLLRDQNTES